MNTGQEPFQWFFSNQPSYKLFHSYLVHSLNNKRSHQHTDHIGGDKSYSEILKSPVDTKDCMTTTLSIQKKILSTYLSPVEFCGNDLPLSFSKYIGALVGHIGLTHWGRRRSFQNHFLYERLFCIFIQIPLMLISNGLNNNRSSIVQFMTWCPTDDKSLSEPMMS